MIGDALNEIEDKAHSVMKKDTLTLSSDTSSVPEIEIPGTKSGIRTIVEAARQYSGANQSTSVAELFCR